VTRTSSSAVAASDRRRAIVVVISFVASMTFVGGLLILTDPTPAPRIARGRPAMSASALGVAPPARTILDTEVPLDRARWRSIVIDDTANPFGTVETVAREHQGRGIEPVGCHFLIGNGRGLGDGVLHVTHRWNRQQPAGLVAVSSVGSEEASSDADVQRHHSEHGITILLVGDGESGSFGDGQIERLVDLVAALCDSFDIPVSEVRLHADLADDEGPGPRFPREGFFRGLSRAAGG